MADLLCFLFNIITSIFLVQGGIDPIDQLFITLNFVTLGVLLPPLLANEAD